MNYIDRYVGARLRRERIALGRSLGEQADLVGICGDKLRLFEIGLVRIYSADLFKSLSSLGLRSSQLFDEMFAHFPSSFDRYEDRPDA